MESFRQDFHYAARSLCKQPRYTFAIVFTLALGIRREHGNELKAVLSYGL